ncbi:MAG: hypothetical protein JNG84_12030 [Archangium sp.]|nr:hypothetical protein [Archangium sp.]
MRFLVAGLILIAVGVSMAEWLRRNPIDAKAGADAAPKVTALSEPMKALIATGAPGPEVAADANGFIAAVKSLEVNDTGDGFVTRLRGECSVRALASGKDFAVAVVAVKDLTGLVKVPAMGDVSVLSVRPAAVSAVAVDGATVWWAEGGQLWSVGADGVPRRSVTFTAAGIAAVAARGDEVLAVLVPRDGDPFSTEPTGAVVRIRGKDVSVVVGELVRPHDALLAGDDVFFVAGYPSGLMRASLDGAFSARIAERADGPIAFDGDGVVHRFPQSNAPEVRRVARAGGSLVTLLRGDADWLVAAAGLTHYTSTGIGARLHVVRPGAEARDVLKLEGAPRGLALAGDRVVVATLGDDGATRLRVAVDAPARP